MKGWLYRIIMKIAHRYHWHYAPPIYPEGDIQLWCKWCGFRQTIKKNSNDIIVFSGDSDMKIFDVSGHEKRKLKKSIDKIAYPEKPQNGENHEK